MLELILTRNGSKEIRAGMKTLSSGRRGCCLAKDYNQGAANSHHRGDLSVSHHGIGFISHTYTIQTIGFIPRIMSQTILETSTAEVPKTTTKIINPREALLLKLKGQSAHIPNLKPVFADWRGISSRHMSPWVEPLREKVNTRLQG